MTRTSRRTIDGPERYLAVPSKNELDLGHRLALALAAPELPDATTG
jgi:hypothetical protein